MGCAVEATCSPDVERKVIAASTEARSYAVGSKLLDELSEIDVSAKQCERISGRVGRERIAERDARLQAYEQLPLPDQRQAPPDAPSNSWNNRVAAVIVDGGRAQLRDERWGQPHPVGEALSWWREPKVACLATFLGQKHASDPIAEVPQCLLDPLWVIPRVKEIKRGRHGDLSDCDEISTAATLPKDKPPRWSPEPLVRSVVATFQAYEPLGRLAKVEAYHRGFTQADRKAFLGDGHLANWGIHEREFADYTAITDLLHALSYIYQAAFESTPDMASCWERCKRWITWTWQGNVRHVIHELELLVVASEGEKQDAIQESLTYLRNNASRMNYDEHRAQGLPITTTLIESTIKQVGRRMKGTEKFWGPNAEPQLQLVADRMSETKPLDDFWIRRENQQTGFRKSRATT